MRFVGIGAGARQLWFDHKNVLHVRRKRYLLIRIKDFLLVRIEGFLLVRITQFLFLFVTGLGWYDQTIGAEARVSRALEEVIS